MARIKVKTDASKVRIKLGEETKSPVTVMPPSAELLKPPEPVVPPKKSVLLSLRLINLMEIRAESVFRPGEEDVEVVYALSGSESTIPTMLHQLSSSTVVEEATPEHITSSVEGMVVHIKKERGNDPKLVVAVHTHPESVPAPSEADKRYFQSAAQTMRSLIPDVNIIFGVHAVSGESIKERREPAKTSKNVIKWSSITRGHEVGFYTQNAEPYEVEIVG